MNSAAVDTLYLARCELGREPRIFLVSAESLRVPDYNKPRARVIPREPKAWLFDAQRTALGEQLCSPGTAAIGYTKAQALDAAMKLMSQHRQARAQR